MFPILAHRLDDSNSDTTLNETLLLEIKSAFAQFERIALKTFPRNITQNLSSGQISVHIQR
jgi:hypothetical protein